MENYKLVLLRDPHLTDGFTPYCFRDASGKPQFIQECNYPCRYYMPGFREGEVFKADSLLELLNQMYMKHYTILDPFDIIISDLLSLR